MTQQKKPSSPQQPNPRVTIISVILFLVVAFFVGQQFMVMSNASSTPTDSLITSEFTQAVEQDRVTKVVYSAGDYKVTGTYYPAVTAGSNAADAFNKAFDAMNARMATKKTPAGGVPAGVGTTSIESSVLGSERGYTSTFVGQDALAALLKDHPEVSYQVTLPSEWLSILSTLLPILLIGALLFFFFNQMQKANNSQMSFGKAKTKKNAEERPDVKFSDVAGVDEAVEEMQEIKDFLSNPAKYQSMGAKVPRGCLLVGPPGTGKTLLARAVAGEAGVPFFSISGSDFVEMFVGVGASRVRDLFQQAKDAAPSIIFIDEIDAVGRQRGAGLGGGHDEREQTLNQLLVEMDGFGANEGVIVIAATNRKDILDNALLRPGRFDRQVYVGAPDVKGREAVLKVHARNKQFDPDVKFSEIAKTTAGFTGADLENLLNEAALLAARRNKKLISQEEIEESLLKVVMGVEKKSHIINEHDKRLTAYHEAGHAICFHVLPTQDPVHHVTIIPRSSGAGGFTMPLPEEDQAYRTKKYMEEYIIVCLGGRVAEQLTMEDISTGAYGDIKQATQMARAMVTSYGMSERIGPIDYGSDNGEVFLGRDLAAGKGYSEVKAAEIDDEIHRIIEHAYHVCEKLLSEHMDEMKRVAEYLIRNETMDGETFVKVYNGEIVPDKIVGEDLMTELQQELHAKVSKPAESAEELAKVEEAEKDLDPDKQDQ